ncbi:DNA-binding protein [Helicobacter magdeburgensis]|uniref:DNA-binding protein n=2 Tax=Helicobacteraceae TaxID=72293 RepID=A0A4U8T2B5_9HELI|nr:DNA-binding protein [Helicobacter magdeburgensis]
MALCVEVFYFFFEKCKTQTQTKKQSLSKKERLMNSATNTIDQRQESQQNEAQEESKEGMFIRMAEVAKILGVSYPTAREILKRNNITKYVLTPRIIYYKRSEVEQIFTNNGISI